MSNSRKKIDTNFSLTEICLVELNKQIIRLWIVTYIEVVYLFSESAEALTMPFAVRRFFSCNCEEEFDSRWEFLLNFVDDEDGMFDDDDDVSFDDDNDVLFDDDNDVLFDDGIPFFRNVGAVFDDEEENEILEPDGVDAMMFGYAL